MKVRKKGGERWGVGAIDIESVQGDFDMPFCYWLRMEKKKVFVLKCIQSYNHSTYVRTHIKSVPDAEFEGSLV